jgi:2-polyprenyl-6-methoxyphenol hydroxylase-like FAD-dependent oxidoreductase
MVLADRLPAGLRGRTASRRRVVDRARSILIAGAGIGGPTLAYWLAEHGFEPVLVEQAPALRTGGYMIDFWGVGFDVAERMGIAPALRDVGYDIARLVFIDARGRERSGMQARAMRRVLGDRFVSVVRGDLARAIFDAARSRAEVHFGDEVVEMRQHEGGVDVTFARRGSRRFDLVVGCDGLHSRIRTLAWGPEKDHTHDLGYYAASFLTRDYPRRAARTYLSWAAPGRQISRYALRDDRTAFLFVFRSATHVAEAADRKTVLRALFAQDPWIEIPEILARLDSCDDLYFDAVTQVRLPAWTLGRVALVGDAAFCPSLLAGEGAGLAMAAAYVLAGELAVALGDRHLAFPAYEQRLRNFIEAKQRAAARFASSFAPSTRAGLVLRDLVLHVADAIPAVGDWIMRRLLVDTLELPRYGIERPFRKHVPRHATCDPQSKQSLT